MRTTRVLLEPPALRAPRGSGRGTMTKAHSRRMPCSFASCLLLLLHAPITIGAALILYAATRVADEEAAGSGRAQRDQLV